MLQFQEFSGDDGDVSGSSLGSPLQQSDDEHQDQHQRENPPDATDRPVLLYSHGMYSWRQVSSCTFEMLASHG